MPTDSTEASMTHNDPPIVLPPVVVMPPDSTEAKMTRGDPSSILPPPTAGSPEEESRIALSAQHEAAFEEVNECLNRSKYRDETPESLKEKLNRVDKDLKAIDTDLKAMNANLEVFQRYNQLASESITKALTTIVNKILDDQMKLIELMVSDGEIRKAKESSGLARKKMVLLSALLPLNSFHFVAAHARKQIKRIIIVIIVLVIVREGYAAMGLQRDL